MERFVMTTRSCVGAALLLALVSGCTTLVNESYTYGTKSADGKLKGMPYTLNKPAPSVTRTVAAETGKETFQVTMNYVADSTKRYTLQIDPSLLSSIDFSMTFDAFGSFSEATAKSVDQTGAVIASIGKVAALAAADSASEPDVLPSLIQNGDSLFTVNDATWSRIKKQWTVLGSSERVRAEYAYENAEQLSVLQKLLDELKKYVPKDGAGSGKLSAKNTGAQQFWNKLKELRQSPTAFASKEFYDEVERLYAAGDFKKLNELKTEELKSLEKARAEHAVKLNAESAASLRDAGNHITILNGAIKGTPGEVALLTELTGMTLAEWQKRTVKPISKEIEETQQKVRIAEAAGSSTTDLRRSLNGLLQRKAVVLGVSQEYQRREELTALLLREKEPKNLKLLREERDALDVAIAAAEPAKPKPKVASTDEPSLAFFTVEKAGECIDGKTIIERLGSQQGGPRPKYVVVVRSLEPASTRECKQEKAGSKETAAEGKDIGGAAGPAIGPQGPGANTPTPGAPTNQEQPGNQVGQPKKGA